MQTLTRGSRALAAVGSALLLSIGIGLTATSASAAGPYDDKTIIDQGHTDVFFASQDGAKSVLQIKDDATVSPPEYGAPEDYVLHVKPSVAERTATAFVADNIPGFTNVGDTIYVLPQNNRPGEIFAGWGHSLPAGSNVEYTVTGYEGPGNFATWQSGEDGPVPFLNQAAGIPTSFTSPANHEHKNWGFTDEGEYKLTVTATVTLPGDEVLEVSDPVTYTFWVGEELPEDEPVETTLSIEGLADEYEVGDVASLTAVQDPQTDEDHYHWFIKRSGDEDFSTVPGALTGALEHTVAEGDDGAQIKVELYDHDHNVIAASAPVVLELATADDPGDGDDQPGEGDDQPGNGGDQPGGDDKPGDQPGDGGGSGDKPGDGDGKGEVSSPGKLPSTGADIVPFAPIAGLVLLLAAGAAFAARRRLAEVGE